MIFINKILVGLICWAAVAVPTIIVSRLLHNGLDGWSFIIGSFAGTTYSFIYDIAYYTLFEKKGL